MKRLLIALAAISTIAASLAIPATAGNASVFIEGSKMAQGGFSDQTALRLADGETELVYVKAKNTRTQRRTAFLSSTKFAPEPQEYRVRYYNGAEPEPSKDITDEVGDDPLRGEGSDGYRFALAPGASKLFSVKIKHTSGASSACIRPVLRSGSEVDFTFFAVNDRNACQA